MPGTFLEQQRGQGVSGRVNGTAVASEIIEVIGTRMCIALLGHRVGTLAFIFNMDAIGGL